jgi:hypothetical protein
MAPPVAPVRGEHVLGILVNHLLALPPDAFADASAAYMHRSELPPLPAGVQAALCEVATRAAHAATVSLLACASKAARVQVADAATCAPPAVRAAQGAKLAALCDVLAAAHAAALLDHPAVRDALVDLCATDAQPPLRAVQAAALDADEAAQWRALAQAAEAQLGRAETTGLIDVWPSDDDAGASDLSADDDETLPWERRRERRREWSAVRFARWLSGLPDGSGTPSGLSGPGGIPSGTPGDASQPDEPYDDDLADDAAS